MAHVSYRFVAPNQRQAVSAYRPSFRSDSDYRVNGYIAVAPKSKEPVFSFGILSFGVVAFVLFKVLLVVLLNPAVYLVRVGYLFEGNAIEQFAARLLSLEPVTEFISQAILFFV